ncbi:MAG: YlmC/YmxH family sporulation protein [Oscillospiraceae bacterium]|nr:YlmC/YmxH family sporulation protein [Oscillospiraceae bacterium]
MEQRLSDLRDREVISISDGRRLGYVSDALVDTRAGRISALIVPGPARFFGLFGREDDYVLPWGSITRVGPDIILVDAKGEIRRSRRERAAF